MTTHSENIRNTQRAPRSCFLCSQRKTKCDKSIPCQPCRSRGQADDCFVETVKVKGRIVTSDQSQAIQPSYSELLEENNRLRSLALQGPVAKTARPLSSLVLMDQQEQEIYVSLRNHYRPAGISNASDVIYPSENCCSILFSQAADWAWLHSAVSPATLEQQKLRFKPYDVNRESPSPSEASWLALYFSHLAIGITVSDEASLKKAGISGDKTALLRENWYDSALYFLHQADFLRLLDVRNIQTISILGAVFSNFGDLNLYYNLLGCAVRIAESLGINNDYTHFTGILPDLRSQRRLWWSLVVLDWLNLPLGQTCISENDFIVELPSIGSDPISERDLDSNNHQAMMCKIAQLLYRFQATLCDSTDWETVEKTVAIADGRIIDLMEELGVGSMEACTIAENPATTRFYGPTQLRNLLLVLFYYRILINRTLIKRPRPSSAKEVTLSRCLKSAHSIIKLFNAMHKTGQLVPTWSMFLPLYSAANIIAQYGDNCSCEAGHEHLTDITAAIQIFDSMSHKSVFGANCARKLSNIARSVV